MDTLEKILSQIQSCCEPLLILEYGEKRSLTCQSLKSVSFCIVVGDKLDAKQVRHKLYLAIDAEFPVTLTVYTKKEWTALIKNPDSHATWIREKGRILYESPS